jgi:hypothetical protein
MTTKVCTEMNDDIGELLAALGVTLRMVQYLEETTGQHEIREALAKQYDRVGARHRDRQQLLQSSGWISVTSRKPKLNHGEEPEAGHSDYVIIRHANDRKTVGTYGVDEYGPLWLDQHGYHVEGVTHWMPLP